jgi:hypothetical protein
MKTTHPEAIATGVELRSRKYIGRTVGALLLLHFATGLIVPFVLLDRVRGDAGFLENAAANPGPLRAAVLLLFVGGAIAIGISIRVMPVLRRHGAGAALGLVAISVAGFSLQAVDNGALLSLLSLSERYATADAGEADLVRALDQVVGSARRWAHFASLLILGSWILGLFGLLYRARLVPRPLAIFGVAASLLQITGVPLRAILGYTPDPRWAMPLAPAYVALAVWLMVRGFPEQRSPLLAAGRGATR